MKKLALALLLLSGIALADQTAGIVDATPSTYAQKNLMNMTIGAWFTKANTNDIVFVTTEYQMGFLIPGTDKTTQTAFLMAVQSNRPVNFYVESVHSDPYWQLNAYGAINNFGVRF